VRAVIVSHLYADPANRAKLRSLAGLGVTLAAAVPDQLVHLLERAFIQQQFDALTNT